MIVGRKRQTAESGTVRLFGQKNRNRSYSSRRQQTDPRGGPSKIAAGASASRLSSTETEVRTVGLRAWGYGVG